MTTRTDPRTTLPTRPPSHSGGAAGIEVEHVTKRYGHNTVVDDLSFAVQPGRVTGFLGPNGSGKSTTMKILLDLASSDGGHATIGGRRYRDIPDPGRMVGAVLDANAFHPGRSGRDHLRVLADAAGVPSERVEEMLAVVGIEKAADRHVGAYSLGMKQRLGLGAALLGDPSVLILDEPGNGLDPQGIRTLRDLLRSRAANGNTVFVSSHLLAEVEHLADDVIVINRGRLVTSGPLRDLQSASSFVRTPSPDVLKRVLEAAGAVAERHGDDTLVVNGPSIDEIGARAFRAGIELHELSPHAGSLEDLFLDWTRDGAASVPPASATKEGSS